MTNEATAHAIFPPWHFDRWAAVDDRVRGGSSQSHLEPIKPDNSTSARFWGTLGKPSFCSDIH